MKNIHLLKTEQKSNLYYNTNNKCFQVSEVAKDSTPLKQNYFVYITNDEKIKENTNTFNEGVNGDWFYNTKHNFISKIGDITDFDFKIVLTNDPQLINDGVQEIEKSVLISFAENTPDYIEVTKMLQVRFGCDWHDLPNQTEGRDWNGIYRHIYTVKIPQKENLKTEKLYTKQDLKHHIRSIAQLCKDDKGYDVEKYIINLRDN